MVSIASIVIIISMDYFNQPEKSAEELHLKPDPQILDERTKSSRDKS